jgi:hypothetical protein
MATPVLHVYPGAGVHLDFWVEDDEGNRVDISGWTVTAKLLRQDGTEAKDSLPVAAPAADLRLVRVTGPDTRAAAGSSVIARIEGVPQGATDMPVVQEYVLVIGSL